MKILISLCMILSSFLLGGCGGGNGGSPNRPFATVENKVTHYEVMLDYETGAPPREMGRAYAKALLETIPDLEYQLDSMASAVSADYWKEGESQIPLSLVLLILQQRVKEIYPRIPQEYREEMEGMAEVLASAKDGSTLGDGKLSKQEFLLLNLVIDVARMEQCCALSVFPKRSATGQTLTMRVTESALPTIPFLRKIHCVTRVKKKEHSFCMIQTLGTLGATTAINDEGIFAAFLDAPTQQPYSARGKRSYPFDLRYAMEHSSTLEEVAAYMSDPEHHYAFNHLVFLSSPKEAKVLENNFSGVGTHMRRALRSSTSELNPGILWDDPQAIATVTSFVLKGNDSTYHWNHPEKGRNSLRWETLRKQLKAIPGKVTPQDMKSVLTYHEAPLEEGLIPEPGDIYTSAALQLILVDYASKSLKVAFLPPENTPQKPLFKTLAVDLSRTLP